MRSSCHFCKSIDHFVLPAADFSELPAIPVDPGLEMKASLPLGGASWWELELGQSEQCAADARPTKFMVVPWPVPAWASREGTAWRAQPCRAGAGKPGQGNGTLSAPLRSIICWVAITAPSCFHFGQWKSCCCIAWAHLNSSSMENPCFLPQLILCTGENHRAGIDRFLSPKRWGGEGSLHQGRGNNVFEVILRLWKIF